MRVFKSLPGCELFRQNPAWKTEFWGGQVWTDGYDVGTVGEGGNWRVVEHDGQNRGRPREDLRQLILSWSCLEDLYSRSSNGSLCQEPLIHGQ